MRLLVLVAAVGMVAVCGAGAPTQKALTNADIVNMTKQGFEPGLIVKAIESSGADFDVSAQGLMDLKSAGVNQTVMEAMLSAEAKKPSSAVEAVHGATV